MCQDQLRSCCTCGPRLRETRSFLGRARRCYGKSTRIESHGRALRQLLYDCWAKQGCINKAAHSRRRISSQQPHRDVVRSQLWQMCFEANTAPTRRQDLPISHAKFAVQAACAQSVKQSQFSSSVFLLFIVFPQLILFSACPASGAGSPTYCAYSLVTDERVE